MLLEHIQEVSNRFLKATENKEILVVSHHDTDGITSAVIIIKALKRMDKKFSVRIVKNLDNKIIQELPAGKIILFLDLASNSLEFIEKSDLQEVFIIDHHEITQRIPAKVAIINPQLEAKEKICSAGLAYLFCKSIDANNKYLAPLAVIGMIGDMHEKNLDKLGSLLINDAGITRKRGILLYPSTRPLNKTLEFSAEPYIPRVTGNPKGTIELLQEAEIQKVGGQYKKLIELDDKEMARLTTAILLRMKKVNSEIIGNIYLVKLFGKLEDAREISAKINACSRLGESQTALLFCLENQKAKKRVETIYAKYKQHLLAGLEIIKETPKKIIGKDYLIIHAEDRIKDTIIGTIASILANSSLYEEGTIITTMAYDQENPEKVKVSLRLVGKNGRNVKHLVERAVATIDGEFGGHYCAAGCTIPKNKEQEFLQNLRNNLEIQTIKI